MYKTGLALMEQTTRLAEFKRVTGGDFSSRAKLREGGFAAREITLDFQRIGSRMSAYNQITAFMNVGVQDIDKIFRIAKADPERFAMKGAALITAPSLALWYANKDDERYKALPDWQKNLFWIFPTDSWQEATALDLKGYTPSYLKREVNGKLYINKGSVYRIPKPGALGIVFGSLPERIAEAYTSEDPSRLDRVGAALVDYMSPSVIPDSVLTPMEHLFNKNLFTKMPVVPHQLEGVAGDLQYTHYTSELSRALGKGVAGIIPSQRFSENKSIMSPVVFDHYIRGYTGQVGQYALMAIDAVLPNALTGARAKPTMAWADVPEVKAFVARFPAASMQPIVDFNESQKTAMGAEATLKKLEKEGRFEDLASEMKNPYVLQEKLSRVRSIKQDVDNIATAIDVISTHVKDPDEKRQLIDGYYYAMLESAKRGNKVIEEIRKQINPKDKSWTLFKTYKQ
jgi:hypothetical protein